VKKATKAKATTSRLPIPNQPLPFRPPNGNHCQLEPRSFHLSSDNNNVDKSSASVVVVCSYSVIKQDKVGKRERERERDRGNNKSESFHPVRIRIMCVFVRKMVDKYA